jgi:hypothetical protein
LLAYYLVSLLASSTVSLLASLLLFLVTFH